MATRRMGFDPASWIRPDRWVKRLWIATLAIAGIWPFAGFFSKDEIIWYAGARAAGTYGVWFTLIWIMALAAAMITAVYMTRLMIMTFHGKNRTGQEEAKHLHEAPAVMWIPLAVLAVLVGLALRAPRDERRKEDREAAEQRTFGSTPAPLGETTNAEKSKSAGAGSPGKRLPKEGVLSRNGWRIVRDSSVEKQSEGYAPENMLDGKPMTSWHSMKWTRSSPPGRRIVSPANFARSAVRTLPSKLKPNRAGS